MKANAVKVEKFEDGDRTVFNFSGELDENGQIDVVLPEERMAVIDLQNLKRVNSAGVLQWIEWTKNNSHAQRVSIRKIHPSLVKIASLVDGVLPKHWELESFFVPYAGEASLDPENVLYVQDQHFTSKELRLPSLVSSLISGERLTIDVLPEKYFHFLKVKFPGIKIVLPSK